MKRQLLAILSAIIALTVSYASADTAMFRCDSPTHYPDDYADFSQAATFGTNSTAGSFNSSSFNSNKVTLTTEGSATKATASAFTLSSTTYTGTLTFTCEDGYKINSITIYGPKVNINTNMADANLTLKDENDSPILFTSTCNPKDETSTGNAATYYKSISPTSPCNTVSITTAKKAVSFGTIVVEYSEASSSGDSDLDPTWTWDFGGESGISSATVTYAGADTVLPELVGADDQNVSLSSTNTKVLSFDAENNPVFVAAGETTIIASVDGYKALTYTLTIEKGIVGKWVDAEGNELTNMNVNAPDGLPSFIANIEGYSVTYSKAGVVSLEDGQLVLGGESGQTSVSIYGPNKGEWTDDPLWDSPAVLWVTVPKTIITAPWSWNLNGEEAVYVFAGEKTILPTLENVPEGVTPAIISSNSDVVSVEDGKLVAKSAGKTTLTVEAEGYTYIDQLDITISKGEFGKWMIGDNVVTEATYDANYPTELPHFVVNDYATGGFTVAGLNDFTSVSNNTLSVDNTKVNVGDQITLYLEAQPESASFNNAALSLNISKKPSYVGVFTDPETGEWVEEWTLDLSEYNAATDEEKAMMLPVYTVYPNNLVYFPLISSDETVATFDANGIKVLSKGVTKLQINNGYGNYDGNFVLTLKVIGSAKVTEEPVAFVTSKYGNVTMSVKEKHKWFEGYPIAPYNVITLESEEGAKISWSMDGGETYYESSQISFDGSDAGQSYVFYIKAEKEGKETSEIIQLPVTVKDWILVENDKMLEENKYFVFASAGTYTYAMLNNGNQNEETGEGSLHYGKNSTKVNNGRAIRNMYDLAIMERDNVNQTMKVINTPAAFSESPYISFTKYAGNYFFNYNDISYARPVGITINKETAIANVTCNGYSLKLNTSYQFTVNGTTDMYVYTWADPTTPELTITHNEKVVSEDAINDDTVVAGDVITVSAPFGFTMSGTLNGTGAEVNNRTVTFVIPEKTAEVALNATAVCGSMNLTFGKTLQLPVYEMKYYHIAYDNEGNQVSEEQIFEDQYGEFTTYVNFGDKVRVVGPEVAAKIYVKAKDDKDWTPNDSNVAIISAPRAHDTWFDYLVQALDADENVICNGALAMYVSGVADDSSTDDRHNFKGQEAFGGMAASSSLAELKWLADETHTASHDAGNYHIFVPCGSEVALVNGHGLVINDGSLIRVGLTDNSARRITKLTFKGDDNCAGIRIGRYAGDNNAHMIHPFTAVGKLGAQQGDGTITWEYDPNDDFNLREIEIWHNPAARSNAPRRAAMKVAANSSAAALHEMTLTTDQPTGIDEVTTETMEVKYFDMQGRRVNATRMLPGLYIRVIGNESSKVMVK